MWFINAVLHLVSCPQSVFLPFQMRNEGLFWDWRNPKYLLHYSICDPSTQAWGWQSNLAPSKRYQCCRKGTVSDKKKQPLKTFQGNRARNGTHGHIQIDKEQFHLIKNLPAPSNINDNYYWLHFHISSCSNYLLGWYNIKEVMSFGVCKVCWISLNSLMSKTCREGSKFPSNSPQSHSHKYSRVLPFTKKQVVYIL